MWSAVMFAVGFYVFIVGRTGLLRPVLGIAAAAKSAALRACNVLINTQFQLCSRFACRWGFLQRPRRLAICRVWLWPAVSPY